MRQIERPAYLIIAAVLAFALTGGAILVLAIKLAG
tara:strand:+ start:41 stop:145 length:105 start_codon:yes stop_codon:yes gene_type:complete